MFMWIGSTFLFLQMNKAQQRKCFYCDKIVLQVDSKNHFLFLLHNLFTSNNDRKNGYDVFPIATKNYSFCPMQIYSTKMSVK